MTPEARLASSPQDTQDGTVAYARFAAAAGDPLPHRAAAEPGALTFTA